MKKILQIFIPILSLLMLFVPYAFADEKNDTTSLTPTITTDIRLKGDKNKQLGNFIENTGSENHFIQPSNWSDAGVNNLFISIAKGIKDFVIIIAVIFLIIGVIKLLFSDASDDDVKKWKNNIFWTAIGIFFMQTAYAIWFTGTQLWGENAGNPINATFSWQFWGNIINPILHLLKFLASFAFLAMMIYAFYVMVTGNADEKKLETGKKTFLYGIIGFLMIQLPYQIVSLIYRGVPCGPEHKEEIFGWFTSQQCDVKMVGSNSSPINMEGSVGLVAQIFTYFNGFLTLACILMAIYAGWLFLISKGDENTTKKAKNIVLYIAIGLVILVASHAIFRFFLMEGVGK